MGKSSPRILFFLKSGAWIGALSVLLVSFQNCSPSQLKTAEETVVQGKAEGNGDGYGGKPTYVNLAPEGECETGVRSAIVRDRDQWILIRANCKDIEPRVLNRAQLEVSELNPDYISHGKRLFELESSLDAGPTAVRCFGSQAGANGKTHLADIAVRRSPSGKNRFRVVTATRQPSRQDPAADDDDGDAIAVSSPSAQPQEGGDALSDLRSPLMSYVSDESSEAAPVTPSVGSPPPAEADRRSRAPKLQLDVFAQGRGLDGDATYRPRGATELPLDATGGYRFSRLTCVTH